MSSRETGHIDTAQEDADTNYLLSAAHEFFSRELTGSDCEARVRRMEMFKSAAHASTHPVRFVEVEFEIVEGGGVGQINLSDALDNLCLDDSFKNSFGDITPGQIVKVPLFIGELPSEALDKSQV